MATSAIVILPESRALIRQVGSQAWAVLEDVSLDACLEDGRWVARTSVRRVAAHLGLTPGTVARALAKLCAAGLVGREDHRHAVTGRFAEAHYVLTPTKALVPCVGSPHTVLPDAAPALRPPTSIPASPIATPPPDSDPSLSSSARPTNSPRALPPAALTSTPERSTDTCQPFGLALPGRASC